MPEPLLSERLIGSTLFLSFRGLDFGVRHTPTTATSCTAEVKAGTYNTCPVRCLGLAITLMTPITSASTRSIRLAHYVQLASGNLTVSLVVATS